MIAISVPLNTEPCGEFIFPLLFIGGTAGASLSAFVITNRIQLIQSQRPRKVPGDLVWRET